MKALVTVTGSSPDDLKVLLQQLDADRAWLLQQILEIVGGRTGHGHHKPSSLHPEGREVTMASLLRRR